VTRPRHVFIVRRGDLDKLQRLKARFAEDPVEIIADRRARDRRHDRNPLRDDRRKRGRRIGWTAKFPSSTFLIVPPDLAADWVAPARGDVLVVNTGTGAEPYELSVVPGPVQARYDEYELAVERARRFARFAYVDLWYTEDRRTFVLLDLCRPARRHVGGSRR
jgi:hypothetical protein